uniref:Sushi domain-containing protein 2-like n=1 Tax=Saccoglossus kowalevskii TaxID=10224 RepID=A0ABM0M9U3_SACKO|nr:PREDICTED: sushi domain-containing protein 2-like [Saccoglossus kowalevskii]
MFTELYPYGVSHGDAQLPVENDGTSPEVVLTNSFPYYGTFYKSLYINTNGVISFDNSLREYDETRPKIPIRNDDEDGIKYTLIAPFWADVDLNVGGYVHYRQVSDTVMLEEITDDVRRHFIAERDFMAKWALIATWDRVKYHGSTSSEENTFQVVMTTDGRFSFISFIYERLEWAGNDATESLLAAQAGFNAGDYVNFYLLPNNQHYTIVNLASSSNVDSDGVWMYRVDTTIDNVPCATGLCIYPSLGTMLGGNVVSISGLAFDSSDVIICKFGDYRPMNGTFISSDEIRCTTPSFFGVGVMLVSVSRDGGLTYEPTEAENQGRFYVQNYDRVEDDHVTRVDSGSDDWRFAGRQLTLEWDYEEIPDDKVAVEVFVYQEHGAEGPRWEWVYTIDPSTPNDGRLTFIPTPVAAVSDGTDYGSIRIIGENNPFDDGQLNQFAATSVQLYGVQCGRGLLPCPCTLQQVLVDTGRWQVDTGCSMFHGSKCTYHQGALHCARSAMPTNLGGGNQCCYDADGNLMFSSDTDQGSTPDRYHTWGYHPYNELGRVPSMSHWLDDVVTFYYCCLWSDWCWKYMELRATTDCIDYEPSRPAVVVGDPHFVTLDGLEYAFNDMGEFILLKTNDDKIELQGRFEKVKDSEGKEVNATVLTAVVMQDTLYSGAKVEIRLHEQTLMEILVNEQIISLGGQTWLDFDGVALKNHERYLDDSNIAQVTVILERGIGVDVIANHDLLTLHFLLPITLKNTVNGLFGNWNEDPTDDLTTPTGTIINYNSPPEVIFEDFGRSWEITNTNMFAYDAGKSHTDYHDADFVPVFEPPSDEELPRELLDDMEELCKGNMQCEFDVRTTERLDIGGVTKDGVDRYENISRSAQKVVACPHIPTPRHGYKTFDGDTRHHLEGSVITFSCHDGFVQTGTPTRECQYNSKWTGDDVLNDCISSPHGSGIKHWSLQDNDVKHTTETECGTLVAPEHASIEVKVENELHVAYFSCEEGYSISGATKRQCLFEVWSGLDTECYVGIDPDAEISLIIGVSCAVGVLIIIVISFLVYRKINTNTDLDTKSQSVTMTPNVTYENSTVTIEDQPTNRDRKSDQPDVTEPEPSPEIII